MVMFEVNSSRQDPYKNFKFQVLWEGQAVAGLSKMSAVKWTKEVIEWREAGGPSVVRKLPGRTKFEPITLEAGVTHDCKFLNWAEQLTNPEGDAAMSLKSYRKDVTVQMHNLQGEKVISFVLERAWVSEFQASPEMDANANAVAISTLKLEYEGFTVQHSEPTET